MRILKYIFVIVVSSSPILVVGQELPFYSSYTSNPLVYNPSNAGCSGEIDLFLHHRTQWSGFKGSPVSQLFTMSAPLKNINSGLGISFQNDQRGLFNVLTGSVKYAYHAKLNKKASLSFGVGLDIQNRLLRLGESTVRDVDDPLLNQGTTSETFFDASLGIEYHLLDKLTIGLSLPQLIEGAQKSENSLVKNARYFIGQASYIIKAIPSKNIKFQPVVLVRYSQNVPLQFDVNALIHYKNIFMIGAGYRNNYAIGFHSGIKINSFKLRYVYDFSSVNSHINAGLSHEITLGYTISSNLKKKGAIAKFSENLPIPSKKEALTIDEIKGILNLLIDEFLEIGTNNPEKLSKTELLQIQAIMKLQKDLEKMK